MTSSVRPRRSVLYVPGANLRALEKTRSLPADGFIFDLEDSVAPSAKVASREQVLQILNESPPGPAERILRVNGPETPWGADDLAAAATSGADAVLLPKIENAETVHEVERDLRLLGAPDDLTHWCMIETPKAVLHAEEIAAASPRVAALVLGSADLGKNLSARATRGRAELLTSMGLVVLAARAAGVVALDGVHLNMQDDAGFAEACRQAAAMGYDGKTLIHPRTIEIANGLFAPTPAEIDWARRVIEAHAGAEAEGRGVVVLDGRLVEHLHAAEARRVLAIAEAIARRAEAGP